MIHFKRDATIKSKSMVYTAVAAVLLIGGAGVPVIAHALSVNSDNSANVSAKVTQYYVAQVHELNNTDVHGTATFTTSGNELTVTVEASGLEPGVHPMHIHGKDQAKAECPTMAQDTNGDGYLSVIEGAPSYGLIKLNLTNPQTTFGTPPTPALFYPFAGTPNNANFPVVGSDGLLHFSGTYMFDSSASAQAAFNSLTPLGDNAIVIHGATAPKSVDAPAFAALGKPYATGTDLTVKTYDVLLPAGCGVIHATGAHQEADTSEAESESESETDTSSNPTQTEVSPFTGADTFQTQPQGSMPSNNADTNTNAHINPVVTTTPPISVTPTFKIDELQKQVVAGFTSATATMSAASSFNSQVAQLSASFSSSVNAAIATYHTNISAGMSHDEARNQLVNAVAAAKDRELSGFTESRNQLIDTLNHSATVGSRDAFLNGFNTAFDQYRLQLEVLKNQL